MSEIYPDVVVAEKNMQLGIILGLILSIMESIIIPIYFIYKPFFDNFEAFTQVLGTEIGEMIVSYFFLIMYFLMQKNYSKCKRRSRISEGQKKS
ncbi:MAG TPA: hypothetical protein ENH75_10895 [archaeon]|nr:hypothetical protein [archaeon]